MSAVARRSDVNSTIGLDYHLKMGSTTSVGIMQGAPRDPHLPTTHSIAAPLPPSPNHSQQPQLPLSCPYLSPHATRPPAHPTRACVPAPRPAQARVRRPLGVWPSSWRLWLRIPRAAHGHMRRFCWFSVCVDRESTFDRDRSPRARCKVQKIRVLPARCGSAYESLETILGVLETYRRCIFAS